MGSTVYRLGRLVAAVMILIVLVLSASGATAPAALAAVTRPTGADGQAVVAVNPVINFQGRLLDPATGQAKSDGTYAMTFRLYNLAGGGTALWTETKNVTLTRGLFTTLLGDTTVLPTAIFDGQTLFLGIQFGADVESAPRQRLGYGAYAVYALDAGSLGGQTATAFAPANHTHTGSDIVDGSIAPADLDRAYAAAAHTHTGSDIVDGTITPAKLDRAYAAQAHTHTGSEIVDGTITAADLAPALPKAKFISLDPYEAHLVNSATFDIGAGPGPGIHLADGGFGSFYMGFTLPPDYTTGGVIAVDIVWHTSENNCNIELMPNAMSVARPGSPHIEGPTPDSGVTLVGGTHLQAPLTLNQSSLKVVTLAAPDGVTPLQAGDAITFSLYRDDSNLTDTCITDLVLQGFLVHYE